MTDKAPDLTSFEQPVCALVVGANRGIGRAFVEALAHSSRVRHIWAGCRRPDQAEALQGMARADARIHPLPVDVTDEAVLADAAARIADAGCPLNLVINCAGVLHAPERPRLQRRPAPRLRVQLRLHAARRSPGLGHRARPRRGFGRSDRGGPA